MSEGRFPSRPAAPEDDWFVEPSERSTVDSDEPRPQAEPTMDVDPARGSPGGSERPEERRRRSGLLAVVAAVAAIGVFGVGVLTADAITGSESVELTTTVTTTATTTVTTEAPSTETPPTATTPTTPAQLPVGVVLRPGDENDDVAGVQAALIELGYSTGGADGKFGPATEQAVRDFQSASGLEADGVVGPATLAALATALNQS